ncbi:PAAR-like domain-containing protein [Polyangium aurulentum]|uniref:PAAR-like domain-containing protein n=1 Tax=Polyangium aurulentum TaxID=2567896 RepID=UPI0010AE7E41|nr:PAAR-like domain-containing protein [Polyangium aurulentum]UQA55737.1 DUF4150 domain-containing protein [Polyangium aurulentum]
MKGQNASKSPDALVVSIAPDVCWTPMGGSMVAVPYNIIGRLEHATGTSSKDLYNGKPGFTMASRIPTVEGDEAGTGGGVISGVNCGYCRPVEHSTTYKVRGSWMVREGDLMAMNCAGPEGSANTYGRIVIMNQIASAAGVSLKKASAVSTDPDTGAMVIEQREVLRDPRTGAITEIAQRTSVDVEMGELRTESVAITTKPNGERSYEATAGSFDPATRTYAVQTTSGVLPEGEEVASDRLYFGTSDEGEHFAPPPEMSGPEVADDDPELLADPEVKAALEEQAAAEAEREALEREAMWEGGKMAADVAGIFDPTPASDVIGGTMCLVDGDFVGAGLSLVSVLPYFGDAIAKPLKGTRAAAKIAQLGEKMAEIGRKLDKLTDASKKAIARAKEALRKRRGGGGGPPGPPKPRNPGDGGFTPGGALKPKRTAPSGKPGGKPRGEPTPIKGDGETVRSLTRENETANKLANRGYDVEQNPTPRQNGKRPDYKIEGEHADCYAPTTKDRGPTAEPLTAEDKAAKMDNIRDYISKKVKRGQAERFTINLDDAPEVSVSDIKDIFARKPVNRLEEIIVLKGDEIVHVFP